MDWIDDSVAVGNWMDGFSAKRRRAEGIDMVIDARVLFTRSLIPSRRRPLVDRLTKSRELLVGMSPFEPKVLIFCNRGRDRSAFVAMLYVSKRYGMSHKEAYELVRSKHKVTAFHFDWAEAVDRSP